MFVSSTNDTWSVVAVVESILDELVTTDLGSELSDDEFNEIDGFRARLHSMLKKD